MATLVTVQPKYNHHSNTLKNVTTLKHSNGNRKSMIKLIVQIVRILNRNNGKNMPLIMIKFFLNR